ncbi:hypothetical protein [Bradyrhizobium sp. SZCCHNRI1009]|uniref:hypothetical protein n=1 Tax=Bradyrhizobium sp. SZCCHNRI1009 TaxID=3057277 RepID=UPI0029168AC9|nr:hypothetical protein [Bradyrhizobium sp. SZCCHNRI1009]
MRRRKSRSAFFDVRAKGFDDVQLNVTRAVQEDPLRYCGAACLQMILKSYNIEDTQTNIWNATRPLLAPQSNGVWYTDPRAVSTYLDSFEAITRKVKVQDIASEQFTLAVNKAARTILQYQCPVAGLVWSGGHWVVIAGVQGEFDDNTRTTGRLTGFWIADPSRGETGIVFHPFNQFMRESYFTPCRIPRDTLWKDRLVTVSEVNDEVAGSFELTERPSGGGGVIGAEDVLDIVIADMSFYGVGKGSRVLGGGAVPTEPVAVNVIGSEEQYFIAPVEMNGRLVWAAVVSKYKNVIFNDLAGLMMSDQFLTPPSGDALKRLLAHKFTNFAAKKVAERQGLWWLRSVELSSLFHVARVVSIDNVDHYVTADNEIYTELHPVPDQTVLAG